MMMCIFSDEHSNIWMFKLENKEKPLLCTCIIYTVYMNWWYLDLGWFIIHYTDTPTYQANNNALYFRPIHGMGAGYLLIGSITIMTLCGDISVVTRTTTLKIKDVNWYDLIISPCGKSLTKMCFLKFTSNWKLDLSGKLYIYWLLVVLGSCIVIMGNVTWSFIVTSQPSSRELNEESSRGWVQRKRYIIAYD